MAQRPIWRGNLRLALVSCPIALYSANHDGGALHFNLLNPKTGNRIKMITQDAETGQALSRADLVKGYEYSHGNYIVLTDDDFENAKIESSSTLKIEKFVDARSIDPIYYESSYYVVPDGSGAEDVYTVLHDAIAGAEKIALSHVVITRREHPVAIMPLGKGLVLHTLHQERELNDYGELFDGLPSTKPDPEMIQLAVQLIDRQSGVYDPTDVEDRYEARLRAVIDAKLKGEGLEPAVEQESDRTNVVDLMAALRESLSRASQTLPAGTSQKATKKQPSGTKAKRKAQNKLGKKASASAKPPARRRA